MDIVERRRDLGIAEWTMIKSTHTTYMSMDDRLSAKPKMLQPLRELGGY